MEEQLAAELEWDDELWDHVWERMLDPLERRDIALHVWRRQPPDDLFNARVAAELAKRWRRRAIALALLYTLWTLLWGGITWNDWREDQALFSLVPLTMALIGVLLIIGCFRARARFRPMLWRTRER
ncbi:MAG: hypothetical protein ACR2MA_10135 [Egibacteraceae bacterium]